MNITQYVIAGGENLNSPFKKTSAFPDNAEEVFAEWYSQLGQNDKETENYYEIPVDNENRLYIKSYWLEKKGNRPLCYYVGYLLPRSLYEHIKEYYLLNRGIGSLKIEEVLSAAERFAPIPLNVQFNLPRTAIWTSFQELSRMRFYGEKEFGANLDRVCFAISINNIDDWFSKLFIAVNPYKMNNEYNIIVSRSEPRAEFRQSNPSYSSNSSGTLTNRKKNIGFKMNLNKGFFIVLVLLLIPNLFIIVKLNVKINQYDTKIKLLDDTINDIQNNMKGYNDRIQRLENDPEKVKQKQTSKFSKWSQSLRQK